MNDLGNLKGKVIYILDKYQESRNSDIKLMNLLWWEFCNNKIFLTENGDVCVRLLDLYDLPPHDTIRRLRAKIQNEENRFLPTDEKIRRQRKIKEEQWLNYLGYRNPQVDALSRYERQIYES